MEVGSTTALAPSLARLLREQRERAFARGHAKPSDYVFASRLGTPLHFRNLARRVLGPAMARAELDEEGKPRLRWHDLRHTFASLLIAEGGSIPYVARQLGHSSPSVTLDVYAHLFDAEEHEARTRDALEAAFGTALGGR